MPWLENVVLKNPHAYDKWLRLTERERRKRLVFQEKKRLLLRFFASRKLFSSTKPLVISANELDFFLLLPVLFWGSRLKVCQESPEDNCDLCHCIPRFPYSHIFRKSLFFLAVLKLSVAKKGGGSQYFFLSSYYHIVWVKRLHQSFAVRFFLLKKGGDDAIASPAWQIETFSALRSLSREKTGEYAPVSFFAQIRAFLLCSLLGGIGSPRTLILDQKSGVSLKVKQTRKGQRCAETLEIWCPKKLW